MLIANGRKAPGGPIHARHINEICNDAESSLASLLRQTGPFSNSHTYVCSGVPVSPYQTPTLMHGKAGIRMCNLTWQLRISSTQLVEYLASPSYVPRQRSSSIRGARHILLVRVRSGGTVEVSPNSSISTDPCKTLLSRDVSGYTN